MELLLTAAVAADGKVRCRRTAVYGFPSAHNYKLSSDRVRRLEQWGTSRDILLSRNLVPNPV